MPKYKVTYNEGDHINKSEIIEAENVHEALVAFTMTHTNADFKEIKEATE